MNNECCVTDVTNSLGISQSTSSQNLGILKNAGIVFPKKYGTKTCYIIKNKVTKQIITLFMKEQK